jgi:hypothetical protein
MQVPSIADRLHLLPGRFGARPRTSGRLPFRQLDQFSPADIQPQLVELSSALPHVHVRQSRVASPDCRALWLHDSVASGPAEAFIDGHEFCHVYPLPEGYVHVTLPPSMVEGIVALGWAERHPLHRLGVMNALVMVYAPRDACELSVVLGLIDCGRQFGMGAVTGVGITRSVA